MMSSLVNDNAIDFWSWLSWVACYRHWYEINFCSRSSRLKANKSISHKWKN